MADRSRLTAVPIVDKRGRTTTVYRSLCARSHAPAALLPSVPPVADGVPLVPAGTPLPKAPLRDDAELDAFLRAAPGMDIQPAPGLDSCADRVMQSPAGRAATSLAMDSIDSGAVTAPNAMWILRYAHAEHPGPLALDTLRVAARLTPSRLVRTDGTDLSGLLIQVVSGCRPTGPNGPGITTEEDLDSTAAAAALVLNFTAAQQEEMQLRTHRPSEDGPLGYELVLRNPHLRQLLKERPHDVGRIIEYVADRGVHPDRKQDVDDLRGWLDEQDTALRPGWL